jgi:hypothetical protein
MVVMACFLEAYSPATRALCLRVAEVQEEFEKTMTDELLSGDDSETEGSEGLQEDETPDPPDPLPKSYGVSDATLRQHISRLEKSIKIRTEFSLKEMNVILAEAAHVLGTRDDCAIFVRVVLTCMYRVAEHMVDFMPVQARFSDLASEEQKTVFMPSVTAAFELMRLCMKDMVVLLVQALDAFPRGSKLADLVCGSIVELDATPLPSSADDGCFFSNAVREAYDTMTRTPSPLPRGFDAVLHTVRKAGLRGGLKAILQAVGRGTGHLI